MRFLALLVASLSGFTSTLVTGAPTLRHELSIASRSVSSDVGNNWSIERRVPAEFKRQNSEEIVSEDEFDLTDLDFEDFAFDDEELEDENSLSEEFSEADVETDLVEYLVSIGLDRTEAEKIVNESLETTQGDEFLAQLESSSEASKREVSATNAVVSKRFIFKLGKAIVKSVVKAGVKELVKSGVAKDAALAAAKKAINSPQGQQVVQQIVSKISGS